VTFRINSGKVGFQKVCKMLREPDFIESYCKRVEAGQAECEERESDEEEKEAFNMAQQNHGTESLRHAQIDFAKLKMDCKEFYPNNVLFEMMIPKELLKKNLGLKGIHHLIMELGDCGLLTRQEIVSMLPPLLLDVQSHHLIFDMCAAPGSKTA
jgi:16S rRNA C967 or C1407 C5-methylase (RsmB/RsmF family)